MPRINTLDKTKHLKSDLPEINSGDIVKIHQRIKEVTDAGKERERTQVFEGLVLAHKHGLGINGTITVRKIASGVGVERIFPIHSPNIRIEVVKHQPVTKSKLYYVRKKLEAQPRIRRNKSVTKTAK